ncbi:MAG: DUF3494 domain-containing protein, partial [Holophaga sp.]|nr:DUF3494 domain-containing protein [Holophaga sp.]
QGSLILVALGCGSGNRDPILGGGGEAAMLPMVTVMAPASGSTGVPANLRMITVQFNQPVGPFTGGATFTVAAPGLNPAGTVALDATGRLATFTLAATAAFTPDTTYTATVAGARGAATGLAMPSPWSGTFGVGPYLSVTLPRVASTLPGITAPAGTVSVNATFTQDMDPATLPAAAFTLTASGVAKAGSVSYSAATRTVTFAPAAPLLPATTYTATVSASATSLAGLHLAGNTAPLPASSNYVWSFTTASAFDAVPPTLILEFPADRAGSAALGTVVTAVFSEAMDVSGLLMTLQPAGGTPLSGSLGFDVLTRTAAFTPSADLLPATTYTASVTGAKDLSGNALAAGTLPNPWTFTTGTALTAPAGVALGAAASFGIMATSAITSTGATTINGDVSLDPGTSITGFPPGTINGTIHVDDAVAAQARAGLLAAFNSATALPPGTTVAAGADLGAAYPLGIPPGTYTSGSTMLISTPLTLDAGGNVNAVWIFQIGSSLTSGASLILANGARAANIFWVPVLDATVGVNTAFYGTILAGRN